MTNPKTQETIPSATDTIRPGEANSDTSSKKPLIQSRPIVSHSITVHTSDGDSDYHESVQTQGIEPSKRPVLAPTKVTDKPVAAEKPEPPKDFQLDNPTNRPLVSAGNRPALTDITPPVASPDASSSAASTPAAASDIAPPAASTTADAFGFDNNDADLPQPSADTKKAVEVAARAAKRKQELQAFIDSRQYFMPITTGERKRSIKVSSILTVVIFILALILIDLMLDSGTILLVQKIPHTHFFNITNNVSS